MLHLDPWGVALLEGGSFQPRLSLSRHAHAGLRLAAFREHARHECGQHPANNGTMEEPRTVQGVSGGKLDLTWLHQTAGRLYLCPDFWLTPG